jgi:hypothetical protein
MTMMTPDDRRAMFASLPDVPRDDNGLKRCPRCNAIDRPAQHVCRASADASRSTKAINRASSARSE